MQFVRYHDGSQFRIAVQVPYNGRKFQQVLVVDCNDKRGPHLRLRKVPVDTEFQSIDQGKRQTRKSLASLRRLARNSGPKVKALVQEVSA